MFGGKKVLYYNSILTPIRGNPLPQREATTAYTTDVQLCTCLLIGKNDIVRTE